MNTFRKIILLLLVSFLLINKLQAASLTTEYAHNNSQNGNMFDVNVLGHNLVVTGFDLNLFSGQTDTIKVYEKTGTWVGNQTNSAAWTLFDTITNVTSAGLNLPTFISLSNTIDLTANTVDAFYITISTPADDMAYTNGTQVGKIAAQNSDLEILEGAGKAYAFANTYQPRIWNGTIYYNIASVPEAQEWAMMLLGLTLIGWVARRKSSATV